MELVVSYKIGHISLISQLPQQIPPKILMIKIAPHILRGKLSSWAKQNSGHHTLTSKNEFVRGEGVYQTIEDVGCKKMSP